MRSVLVNMIKSSEEDFNLAIGILECRNYGAERIRRFCNYIFCYYDIGKVVICKFFMFWNSCKPIHIIDPIRRVNIVRS